MSALTPALVGAMEAAAPELAAEAAIPGLGWALLGVTVVAVAGYAILHANTSAEQEHTPSKPGAVTECPDEATEIPCFNPPDDEDTDEFDRQLKEQEEELNKLSPEEVLENIKKYDPNRPAADAMARKEARESALRAKMKELRRKYRDWPNRDSLVEKEAVDYMKTVDATHGPDRIVGGDGVTGVGGRSENRSIGSQWAKKAPGDPKRRADHVRQAAEEARAAGKKKMNVKLKRC